MPPISQLTDRELATVLAALRLWQAAYEHGEDLAPYAGHFAEVSPLSSHDIDELCERLNHH
jgi:hypothetical protein